MSVPGALRRIASPEELATLGPVEGAPPFDPGLLIRHAPDATWALTGTDGRAQARCSLWWRQTPPLPGQSPGLIGHYAARDDAAAARLLAHACTELAGQGCTVAIGPMDGSTWRHYRFLVERGAEPVFLLEPDNPDAWPDHFRAAGFGVAAGYFSAVTEDLTYEDAREAAVAARLLRGGLRVRPLDLSRLDDDLRRLYALSTASFEQNFLYTPIEEAEFLAQYRPLLPRVPPEMVLMAEQGDVTVGFIFGYPDAARAAVGAPLDTAVAKTIARVPGRKWAGVGTVLTAEFQRRVRALGFRRVIHALMHDSNNSRNLSARWGARPIRRYALFSRRLP